MAWGCHARGQHPCGWPGAGLASPWTLWGHTFAKLSFLFCVCCKTASGETECGAASSWSVAPGGSGLEQRWGSAPSTCRTRAKSSSRVS